MSYVVHEIEGKRFGLLTAIRFDHCGPGPERRKYYWLCRCDCGNECCVERYNLVSGKTRSCGCLRSTSLAMTRGKTARRHIPETTKQWIIRHYQHTKNDEIKKKYGLSDGWLHRFARANGLKKSAQFMNKVRRELVEAAKASHIANNSYPPKGYHIPGGENAGFKPGHKETRATKMKRKKVSPYRVRHFSRASAPGLDLAGRSGRNCAWSDSRRGAPINDISFASVAISLPGEAIRPTIRREPIGA